VNVLVIAAAVLAQTPMQEAHTALGSCELDVAVDRAQKARKTQPKQREPLELLAAIFDARGDEAGAKPVYAALKKLPPAPSKSAAVVAPPSTEAIKPGSQRYVVATRVRLRNKPDARSAVVTEPPVNTRLTVVNVGPEWLELTMDGGPRGFMPARFTAANPVDGETLLRSGTQLGREGRWHDAWVALDLAAAAMPSNDDVNNKMRGAAIKAGQYVAAVQSCLPPMAQRTLVHWLRMDSADFGCEMERQLGHRDATYNCSNRRHPTGDPCKDTVPYYAGPAVPDVAARKIHPNIKSLTPTWEHGDIQAFQVCFVAKAPVDWVTNTLRSTSRFPGDFDAASFTPAEDGCYNQERFDHMGAGDVDCGD